MSSTVSDSGFDEELVLPLLEERLVIARESVDLERVKVTTKVSDHQELASTDLYHDAIEVERVPIGREVDSMPQVRHEGDLLVVPVVREVLVKRLLFVEEVRLRRTRHTRRFEQPVVLRSMEAVVEREEITSKEKQS